MAGGFTGQALAALASTWLNSRQPPAWPAPLALGGLGGPASSAAAARSAAAPRGVLLLGAAAAGSGALRLARRRASAGASAAEPAMLAEKLAEPPRQSPGGAPGDESAGPSGRGAGSPDATRPRRNPVSGRRAPRRTNRLRLGSEAAGLLVGGSGAAGSGGRSARAAAAAAAAGTPADRPHAAATREGLLWRTDGHVAVDVAPEALWPLIKAIGLCEQPAASAGGAVRAGAASPAAPLVSPPPGPAGPAAEGGALAGPPLAGPARSVLRNVKRTVVRETDPGRSATLAQDCAWRFVLLGGTNKIVSRVVANDDTCTLSSHMIEPSLIFERFQADWSCEPLAPEAADTSGAPGAPGPRGRPPGGGRAESGAGAAAPAPAAPRRSVMRQRLTVQLRGGFIGAQAGRVIAGVLSSQVRGMLADVRGEALRLFPPAPAAAAAGAAAGGPVPAAAHSPATAGSASDILAAGGLAPATAAAPARRRPRRFMQAGYDD